MRPIDNKQPSTEWGDISRARSGDNHHQQKASSFQVPVHLVRWTPPPAEDSREYVRSRIQLLATKPGPYSRGQIPTLLIVSSFFLYRAFTRISGFRFHDHTQNELTTLRALPHRDLFSTLQRPTEHAHSLFKYPGIYRCQPSHRPGRMKRNYSRNVIVKYPWEEPATTEIVDILNISTRYKYSVLSTL